MNPFFYHYFSKGVIMKKVFLLLLLCMLSTSVFAQKLSSDIIKPKKDIDISNNIMMQAMYDNFLPSFFQSIEAQARATGAAPHKVDTYMKELKNRINKQTLINETYPCLSKIPMGKFEDGFNCFLPWLQKVYNENAELSNILK